MGERLKFFWSDIKVFLKYIFNFGDLLNTFKSERTWGYFSLALFVYFFFFSNSPNKILYSKILIVLWLLFSFIRMYRSGEHRAWERKRMGIIKAKTLKKEVENGRKDFTSNETITDFSNQDVQRN